MRNFAGLMVHQIRLCSPLYYPV